MDLIQLNYFIAAARRGNFTRAAEELHITQPALSHMISALETDLGVKLFDRERRGIRLNANGEVVLRHAEAIFDDLEAMRSELADLSGRITGKLTVAFSIPIRRNDVFLGIVQDFLVENPEAQLTYRQMNSEDILRALRDKTVDLAITSSGTSAGDIIWTQLYRERLGVILSRHHPLCAKPELSIQDLRDEWFFINNAGNDSQDLTYAFCSRGGFDPKVRFEGHHPLYIGQAISRGEGVSFIPEDMFRAQYTEDMETNTNPWADDLTYRRITEDFCVRDCGYAMLRSRYHSRAVLDFCRRLDEQFGK